MAQWTAKSTTTTGLHNLPTTQIQLATAVPYVCVCVVCVDCLSNSHTRTLILSSRRTTTTLLLCNYMCNPHSGCQKL